MTSTTASVRTQICAALALVAATASLHAAAPLDAAAARRLVATTRQGHELETSCNTFDQTIGKSLIDFANAGANDTVASRITALRLAEQAGRCLQDSELLGLALNALSDTLVGAGRSEEAFETGSESVRIHEASGDRPGLAEAWNRVGNAEFWRGRPDAALDAFRQALDTSAGSADRLGQARAWNNIAMVDKNIGRMDEAIGYLRQALAVFEDLDDRPRAAVVLNNIALNYFTQGDYRTALEYNQRSLDLNRSLGLPQRQRLAASLDAEANIYRALGAYRLALGSFGESLKIRQTLGDRLGTMETTHNIGLVYFSQGEYGRAIDSYRAGLRINRTINDQAFLAEALRNIGAAAWRLGDRQRAAANFKESLMVARRAQMRPIMAELLNDLGEMARADGDATAAEASFVEALSLREAIPDHAGVTESLTSMASLRLDERRYAEARRLAERASENASTHNQPELRWAALTVAGAAAHAQQDQAAARTSLEEAVRAIEALSAQSARSSSLERRFFQDKLSPYHELISIDLEEGQNERALRLAENSKARALAQILGAESPASAPMTGEPDQALTVPSDTLVLEYVVTDRGLLVFAITSSAGKAVVTARVVPVSRAALTRQADRFLGSIATRDFAFADEARALYETLVQPFESQVAGKSRLILIPDGPLWNVPFQALMTPRGFLLERLAVSYAPSLAVLGRITRASTATPAPSLLAMGKADFADSPQPALQSLKFAEDDARALQAIYGSDRAQIVLGKAATEDALRAAVRPNTVIHLATHGILDDASPMYSYMALTRSGDDPAHDGRLEAWEMAKMDFSGDLVVLSACDTARGRITRGEGVVGTMWALIAAGARAVVVSQFKIEEQSASQLLIGFHRGVAAESGTGAAALRQAALALLRNPRYAHPYYWAGFILVGDGG